MTHPNTLSVSPNLTVATCSAICNTGCMVQNRTHDGVREGVRGYSPMQADRVTYQRTESPGTAVFEGVFKFCITQDVGSWLQHADSKQRNPTMNIEDILTTDPTRTVGVASINFNDTEAGRGSYFNLSLLQEAIQQAEQHGIDTDEAYIRMASSYSANRDADGCPLLILDNEDSRMGIMTAPLVKTNNEETDE